MEPDSGRTRRRRPRPLGKRITFSGSVDEGRAYGQIHGNDIVLDRALADTRDTDGLLWKILGHEMTHGVQHDAPEAYARFLNAAASLENVREEARNLRRFYAMRGRTVTEEYALDEAAANYGGELLRDTDTAQRFIDRNWEDRTLLQKIRDAIAALVRKLTGKEKQRMREIRRLFDAALDTAARNVRNAAAAQNQAADTRFSINYDTNNIPFVVVEDDILSGIPKSDWVRTVKENLRQKFPAGIRVGNNVIKINKQSRGEMTFSNYTSYIQD